MKQLWKRYADKVDAASLRERVLIFGAAALLVIALIDSALIEPQLARQKRLSQEIARRQSEMQALQAQVGKLALARQANPDEAARKRLEALKAEVAGVESKLAEEQRRFAPPEQIGGLLEEMLSRNRKLQLVDMRTLPVAVVGGSAPQTPAAQKAAKPATVAQEGQIYRHGVEITVTGGYLDLLAYLKDLENLPSQMYWGKLDLSVAAYPQVTLKLSVYTLSLKAAWLVV